MRDNERGLIWICYQLTLTSRQSLPGEAPLEQKLVYEVRTLQDPLPGRAKEYIGPSCWEYEEKPELGGGLVRWERLQPYHLHLTRGGEHGLSFDFVLDGRRRLTGFPTEYGEMQIFYETEHLRFSDMRVEIGYRLYTSLEEPREQGILTEMTLELGGLEY